MRCSVVFGVRLRLLVINISSSSPTINTAAYYQRCVITCETVAVHRRPRLQHLPVAALTQAVKPDIGSESRFLPTPPAFDAPVRRRGSRRNIAMPFDVEKLEWRGYPTVKKILMIFLFVLTRSTIWCWIIPWPWNRGYTSLDVIQTGTIRKLRCGFLFAFHSNYGSILHQFRDKARY